MTIRREANPKIGASGKGKSGAKDGNRTTVTVRCRRSNESRGHKGGSMVPMGAQHIKAAPLSNERNIEHNAQGRVLILGNAASLQAGCFATFYSTTLKGQN